MEGFLTNIEKDIYGYLTTFLDSISIVTGGISVFAISCVTVWMIYKSYLLLAGFSQEPFSELMKDILIKMAILGSVALTSFGGNDGSFYTQTIKDLLINPSTALAAKMSGTDTSDHILVFNQVGKVLDNAFDGLTLVGTKDDEKAPSGGIWAGIKSFFSSIGNSVKNILFAVNTILKLMLITAGALYMAIISFMTVMTSQVFAYISLGVGPLFVFFSAFNFSRGWFTSWLNHTLGYLFTFVAVMIAWNFMLKLTSSYFFDPATGQNTLDWITAAKSFVACFFMAAVVSRIGDLASSWFSAGNITDGTNAVFTAMGYKAAQGAKKGAKTSAEASFLAGKGGYKATKWSVNKLRRSKIKKGTKENTNDKAKK